MINKENIFDIENYLAEKNITSTNVTELDYDGEIKVERYIDGKDFSFRYGDDFGTCFETVTNINELYIKLVMKEIADVLQIPFADYDIARFGDIIGTIRSIPKKDDKLDITIESLLKNNHKLNNDDYVDKYFNLENLEDLFRKEIYIRAMDEQVVDKLMSKMNAIFRFQVITNCAELRSCDINIAISDRNMDIMPLSGTLGSFGISDRTSYRLKTKKDDFLNANSNSDCLKEYLDNSENAALMIEDLKKIDMTKVLIDVEDKYELQIPNEMCVILLESYSSIFSNIQEYLQKKGKLY